MSFATGAGVIIGAGAASGIATNVGIAVLASIFGATGAGLAGYKMNKRVGAIDEFVIESLTEGSSLHCVLTVSGWIEDDSKNAFRKQWRHLWMSREQFTLRYESKYLIELGKAIEYLMSFAVSVAIQQTLMETALAGCYFVGDFLAEILLRRAHGKYPITLIGFSLGARVIYHCLLTMSQRADYAGIIEDVVLLGAPVSASSRQWHQMCRVVGGRIINGYSTSDWLLRFLYRTMNIQFAIAGIGPIDSQKNRKIVNFNLSHLINGHLDYSRKLTEVLKAVGIKVTPHRENSSFNLSQVAKEVDLEEAINRSNIITDAKIKNTVEFDVNLYSDSDRIV
ncbi:unnamed protein product [Dracunculus medinensis]|uniref:DUF726 domain-containing protein n=1 Tax=Dracunculus medinensis TaxID=318479 RepID=A0A3P7PX78_DRAME|nr:unnamed protein product [Dracunculus medinensis]